jgi:hypothetical protein
MCSVQISIYECTSLLHFIRTLVYVWLVMCGLTCMYLSMFYQKKMKCAQCAKLLPLSMSLEGHTVEEHKESGISGTLIWMFPICIRVRIRACLSQALFLAQIHNYYMLYSQVHTSYVHITGAHIICMHILTCVHLSVLAHT